MNEIKNTIKTEKLRDEIHIVEKLLEEDYTSIDIAAALIKMVSGHKKNEENVEETELKDTGGEPGMARLFINIGKNHNISAKDILGAIAGETGLPGDLVGTIDIYKKYTFVEVPKKHAKKVLDIMKNNTIKGKPINIEPANKR